MEIARKFEMFGFFRGLANGQLEGLSEAQVREVPDGISNNILWNLGHILYYEAVFLYGNSGQPLPVPDSYETFFKAGSSPADWTETPDVAEVVERYKTQAGQSASDFAAGKFDAFKPMKINDQVTLDSLEEALTFHVFHEGVHVGRMGTLAKLVK